MNKIIERVATNEAQGAGIPAGIVLAIIRVESGGDTYAWNPEPHYRYLVNADTRMPFRRLTAEERASEIPPADFPRGPARGDNDAEWWGQQASWGLMQVMGAVAREYGFMHHFPALCNPEDGIHYGVKHLLRLHRRFGAEFGWTGTIAAYNAGSPRIRGDGKYENQSYVDKVLSHVDWIEEGRN